MAWAEVHLSYEAYVEALGCGEQETPPLSREAVDNVAKGIIGSARLKALDRRAECHGHARAAHARRCVPRATCGRAEF